MSRKDQIESHAGKSEPEIQGPLASANPAPLLKLVSSSGINAILREEGRSVKASEREAENDRAGSDSAESGRAGSDRAESGRAESDSAESGRAGSDRAESDRAGLSLDLFVSRWMLLKTQRNQLPAVYEGLHQGISRFSGLLFATLSSAL